MDEKQTDVNKPKRVGIIKPFDQDTLNNDIDIKPKIWLPLLNWSYLRLQYVDDVIGLTSLFRFKLLDKLVLLTAAWRLAITRLTVITLQNRLLSRLSRNAHLLSQTTGMYSIHRF